MLEGIEVLNKVEVMTAPDWLYVIGVICLFVWIISFIAVIIESVTGLFNDKWWWIPFSSLAISYIGIMIVNICDNEILTVPTGKYAYKVTIDDSVSMNEFNERYEIIEVEGKIYTIKEKE